MFGLLGGLIGGGLRAAAGRSLASRPILSGLLSRRAAGGGGGGSSISGGGANAAGSSDQPTTIKRDNPDQPPPTQPEENVQAAEKPQAEPVVEQVAQDLKEQPTLQEQKPQPSNPTTPVKPLEGLIDAPKQEAPPVQTAPGTDVEEPQTVVNQADGPQATISLAGANFPSAPGIAPSFLGDKISQLPPRTIFEAPEANPSKAVDTGTKVNNSSPGYSTLGMGSPPASQFSYLRR